MSKGHACGHQWDISNESRQFPDLPTRGDVVRYVGTNDDQVDWASLDDPRGLLEVGEDYTVESVEVHSYHTHVRIVGIPGEFSSVCFRAVAEAKS